MTEDEKIRGQATLTFADHLRGFSRLIVKTMLISAVLLVVAFLLTWAAYLPDDDWLRLRQEPLWALRASLLDFGPFFIGTMVAILLMLIAALGVSFVKMPQANRQVFFEIDREAIVTRDAAGFVLTIPWRAVVATRETKRLLFLTLATGALRFIPWRAFAPRDRARLSALANEIWAPDRVAPQNSLC